MSLIEEFPQIIRNGKRVFEKVMNNVKSANSLGGGTLSLQNNEFVIPSKNENDFLKRYNNVELNKDKWYNRLIYGDNILAMQALLNGDETIESMRGKIDLIYIDPPYDSKRESIKIATFNFID